MVKNKPDERRHCPNDVAGPFHIRGHVHDSRGVRDEPDCVAPALCRVVSLGVSFNNSDTISVFFNLAEMFSNLL